MIAWVEELRSALDAEFGGKPRVATLATVDPSGRPRARTVVCRGVEDDGALWVASDARSDKNLQARGRPSGEMVFWLANLRQQYRAAGAIEVIVGPDSRRIAAWSELSDSARALFFWPPPGLPRSEGGAFPERIAGGGEIPAPFEVLAIRPDQFEHLDLNPHPHRRRRWSPAGWRDVNP